MVVYGSRCGGYMELLLRGDVEEVGYYYTTLWVGTPLKKRTLLLDTGSSLTAFPCSGCMGCGHHTNPYFDWEKSATARRLSCEEADCTECNNATCHYRQQYSEGSVISGVLTSDFVSLSSDGEVALRFTFGCHYAETNLFRMQKADGVLGLSMISPDSRFYSPTLIDRLYEESLIPSGEFSICLARRNGVLTFGGMDLGLNTGAVQTVRLLGDTHYELNLQGVTVQDSPYIDLVQPFRTILDSGTTFTYISQATYEKVWAAFDQFCSGEVCGERVTVPGERKPCFRHSAGPLKSFWDQFPTLSVWIDGEAVEWKAKNYLFAWPDRPHDYCLGVFPSMGGENVLGEVFMRGKNINFNRGNRTIAIAEGRCDSRRPRHAECAVPQSTTTDRLTVYSCGIGILVLVAAGIAVSHRHIGLIIH